MLLRRRFYRGFELGSLHLEEHYKDKHRLSVLFKRCAIFFCTNMEHGAISAVMHSYLSLGKSFMSIIMHISVC